MTDDVKPTGAQQQKRQRPAEQMQHEARKIPVEDPFKNLEEFLRTGGQPGHTRQID